jgi:hypothetical protein
MTMNSGRTALDLLRRLAQPGPNPAAEERCELCSIALAPRHRHLLENAPRRIVCACDACALIFENAANGRFKSIPRDVWTLPDFRLGDGIWESLALPINLAFIFRDSRTHGGAAMFPSPAGATESLLTTDSWNALTAENPALCHMASDVEALLVNRLGPRHDHLIVPIDRCFELVGLVRTHWRGLSGGEAVWKHIESFFDALRAEARLAVPTLEVSHA